MKAKKWSKCQLAEKTNLSESTIFSIFREKMSPRIDTLQAIADAFEISLSDFFNETKNEYDLLILNSLKNKSSKTKEIIQFLLDNLD